MPKLYQTQSTALQLALAVRARRPAGLAQTFAAHVGQFYDREAFDALAREVNGLYAARCSADASTFRARLDRRLYDRHHAPVAWECGDTVTDGGSRGSRGSRGSYGGRDTAGNRENAASEHARDGAASVRPVDCAA